MKGGVALLSRVLLPSALITVSVSTVSSAQAPQPFLAPPRLKAPAKAGAVTTLEAVLFAEATWIVKDSPATVFDGELSFGTGNVMDLKGVISPARDGVPPHAHSVGKGRPGTSTEHYFYDYDGSLTEHWPNGVNQVPAITGSVIRVKPHDGNPAGLVASFIAAKAS